MANKGKKMIAWCKKPIILGLINASLFILLAIWILLFGAGASDSGAFFGFAILLKFLNYPIFILLDNLNITKILKIDKNIGFALFSFIFAFFSFFYWFAIGVLLKVVLPFIARVLNVITNGYRGLVTSLENKVYGNNYENKK